MMQELHHLGNGAILDKALKKAVYLMLALLVHIRCRFNNIWVGC